MGKNSRTNMENKSRTPSTIKLATGKNKKKRKNKMRNNIKKLFNHLRNESDSAASSSNDTIINLDDTVIEQTNNNYKENNNLIIIKDDEELPNECSPTPVHSSTPISKTKILQDVNSIPKNLNTSYDENVINLTKEINRNSYLTIDLTTESGLNATNQSELSTVIDLVNTSDAQDTLRSSNCSMSGDSDVTVINNGVQRKKDAKSKQMKKFASGIAKLDASERGKLLELIAQKIFNGCSSPHHTSHTSIKQRINQSTETVEDAYIKEVILGRAASRNSIGSNIYNPGNDMRNKTGLRMIVIDGSNVAMQHTKGRIFSVKGLKICIDYFLQRGHVVKAFVPHFRCKYGKSTDGKLLDQLERLGHVVYTPSREVQGKMITSYDDRYIVQCAAEFDGVIVSGDNYRDLLQENPRWRHVIENRLLQFTWVGDMIMFPRDPLGRNGPTLQEFLRHPNTPGQMIL